MSISTSLYHRRKQRIRFKLKTVANKGLPRLCVHRTNQHTYAQIFDDRQAASLVFFSTRVKDKHGLKSGANKDAAELVGREIAEIALAKGIKDVIFDRSGYLYHGRIRTLADAARRAGLNF